MVHTVGILGVTGNVGKPTTKLLIEAAEKGKIKLVVLHRPSSNVQHIKSSKDVELRTIDFDGPEEGLQKVVKGINVLISAVAVEGLSNSEVKLVDALAKSPDIVTFIPGCFSTTWTEKDLANPELKLGPILSVIHAGWDRAKEKNIGITAVYNGVFDFFWFDIGWIGSPLNDNVVLANDGQLKNKLPITTMPHLAEALTRLATSDPETIRGKEYSVVTFWPTGEDLLALYTKINGKQAQHKIWTPEERANMLEKNKAVPVGYLDKWANNTYEYESDGRIVDKHYDGPGIEEVARQFKKN